MGDAAEDLLSGLMCEVCGEFIDGDEPGYPRLCSRCETPVVPKRGKKKAALTAPEGEK